MNKNNKQRQQQASEAARETRLSALAVPVALLLVAASALAVVYSSHQSRRLFSELQVLKREGMVLQEEWGRLLLEQSTWASHDRIQRLAEEKLSMGPPREESLQMVRIHGESR